MDARSISSRFRDLVKFLSSVQGDLANVSAPPSFLAPSSVVEVGHCWAQRPALFAAPALETCPQKRSLAVLRLVLASLRGQLYVAGAPGISIKKPLNAFLGEMFLASWTDPECKSTVHLVSEQVSHHPPITAMHLNDAENGVRADGYARVEMTFSTSVNIREVGHAILSVERYDEAHLVPLVDVQVRGFLNGCLYPEVIGTYTVPSTTGYVSEIRFSGAGLLSGKRNAFEAKIYHKSDPKRKAIYKVAGVWSKGWTVTDGATGEVLEKFELDAPANKPTPITIAPIDDQDPWESRRAWAGVLQGIENGDCRQTTTEKVKIEQAQREMRKLEARKGTTWRPLLFASFKGQDHDVFHELAEGTEWKLHDDKTKGVWRVDEDAIKNMQRPLRGGLTPSG